MRAYGEEQLVRGCKQHGIEGLIIVDLPVEEAGTLLEQCSLHGCAFY
jgi:tryptophan synthase